MPEICNENVQTSEFKYMWRMYGWMINYFMHVLTFRWEICIFMVWVSGVCWNLLRKSSKVVGGAEKTRNDLWKRTRAINYKSHLMYVFNCSACQKYVNLCVQVLRCKKCSWFPCSYAWMDAPIFNPDRSSAWTRSRSSIQWSSVDETLVQNEITHLASFQFYYVRFVGSYLWTKKRFQKWIWSWASERVFWDWSLRKVLLEGTRWNQFFDAAPSLWLSANDRKIIQTWHVRRLSVGLPRFKISMVSQWIKYSASVNHCMWDRTCWATA